MVCTFTLVLSSKYVRSGQYGCSGVSWSRVFQVCCSVVFWVILVSIYYYYYYYYFALRDNFANIKSTRYNFKDLQICHVYNYWLRLRCLNYISCQICIHFYDLHIKFHVCGYNCSSFTSTIRRFREVGSYCFTSYKKRRHWHSCLFLKSSHITRRVCKPNVANPHPTSKFRASAVF